MTVIQKTVLVVNDTDHKLDVLLQKGRLGPLVEVKETDLAGYDFFTKSFNGDVNVTYKPCPPTDASEKSNEILLYKHNGKYIVLNGSDIILGLIKKPGYNGTIQGRYVSTVVLKSTRVPERIETPETDMRRFGNISGNSNRFDNNKHDRRARW